MEIIREYYEHGPLCDGETFGPVNARGLKQCVDCAGIFDEEGKGVCITSKKFDENYVAPEEG